MGKQIVVWILGLLVGLGAGYGIAYMASQSEIDALQAENDTLETAKQAAEDASKATLKTAGEQMATVKADLERTRTNAIRVNSDLRKLTLENQRLKAVLSQALGQQDAPDSSTSQTATPTVAKKTVVITPNKPAVAPEPNRPTNTTTTTREYTIVDGDSLWKIAAAELGNGIRFKEILSLNPDINENTKLVIGMKLKLPAK